MITESVERNAAGTGWYVAETPNFRVLHRIDPDLARRTALNAESARAATYRRWFDTPASDWAPRCEVVLYESGFAYAQGTGLSASLPGYTNVQSEAGRVFSRRIDLNCETPDLLTAVLPHEVNHAVMWSEFGRGRLPRWAHEGMAVLSEPRERVEMHLRNLPGHYQGGELFAASDLINMKSYPERHRFGPFYAQSISLVEFLAGRTRPTTFVRFLHDCNRHGAEQALRRHYGWSFAELEYQWTRYAFDPKPARSAALSVEP